jgi:hypothetical protein
MQRRALLAAGATGLTVGLGGCVGSFRDPPVGKVRTRIVDVRAPRTGLTSATLPVVLSFTNTGDRPVPEPTAEYDVFVQGTTVGRADLSLTTIDPGETVTETARVTVQAADVAGGVIEAIQAGEFTVRLTGRLTSEGASTETTMEYTYAP